MGRYLSWLANSVLFVLCCYLVADTANEVFAALLTPSVEQATRAVAAAPPRASGDRSDHDIIVRRNLFHVSTDVPLPLPEEPLEDLEATRLPLRLLGTAAATPSDLSWAAVEDEEARRTVVVQIGDEIHEAIVQRIERRRIVLSENGVLRELVLDDEAQVASAKRPSPPPRQARAPARRGPKVNPRKLAENRFQLEQDDIDDMMRNPANLFSQARILPKYENGEMIGLQINAIKPDSFFEEVGFEDGDVITCMNDIPIDNPQESARVLSQMSEAPELSFCVEKQDGTTVNKEFVR